jgi:Tfp pilus assembly protein PilN
MDQTGPPAPEADRRVVWIRLGVRLAVAAAALFVVAAYGTAWWSRAETERALSARRASLAELQPALEVAARLQARRDTLASLGRGYGALLRGGTPWHSILRELSVLTPQSVTLNELSVAPGGRLRIKGMAFAMGARPEVTLAGYVGKLESSRFFTRLDLVSTRVREDFDVPAVDFEVAARLP